MGHRGVSLWGQMGVDNLTVLSCSIYRLEQSSLAASKSATLVVCWITFYLQNSTDLAGYYHSLNCIILNLSVTDSAHYYVYAFAEFTFSQC